jgi:hypothetical protein
MVAVKKTTPKTVKSKKKTLLQRMPRRPCEALPDAAAGDATTAEKVGPCLGTVKRATPATCGNSRRDMAETITRNNVIVSMGIGTVIAPLVALVAAAIVQCNMVHGPGALCQMPYDRTSAWSHSAIAGAMCLPGEPLCNLTKALSGGGVRVGAMAMALVMGASTYLLSAAFAQHFETKGMFLWLDTVQARWRSPQISEHDRAVVASL